MQEAAGVPQNYQVSKAYARQLTVATRTPHARGNSSQKSDFLWSKSDFKARTKKSVWSCKLPVLIFLSQVQNRKIGSVEWQQDPASSHLRAWFTSTVFHDITHPKANWKRTVAYEQERSNAWSERCHYHSKYLPRMKHSTVWILASSALWLWPLWSLLYRFPSVPLAMATRKEAFAIYSEHSAHIFKLLDADKTEG